MTSHGGRTIYLHVGTPKSGTTYVQSRMEANRRLAADQGLLWPGRGWGRQVRAVDEIRRLRKGASPPKGGEWERLVQELQAWTGDRAVVSMEWMGSLTAHQIHTTVQSLQPARIEVICTARDLLRTVVAHWQETTKNYRTWGWEQFVRELVDEEAGRAQQVFWRQQDVPAIIQRWSRHVPPERIHVVTVPPDGARREVLWSRFCSVVGLGGGDFQPPRDLNTSLGVVSSSLMHRVNLAAKKQAVEHAAYKTVFHRKLARDVLAAHGPEEDPITVDPRTEAWVRERATRLVRELGESGVDIVGDLQELSPGTGRGGRVPTDVTDTELLELCTEALVTLGIRQCAEIAALTADNRRLRDAMHRQRLFGGVRAVAGRVAGRRQSTLR